MRLKALFICVLLAILGNTNCAILEQESLDRKLSLTTSEPNSVTPKRNLALFSNDAKTRQIHELKKDVEKLQGLVKMYDGKLSRRNDIG